MIFIGYLLGANTLFAFDRADTLRGSNGRGRAWWDVVHYALSIELDTATQYVRGQVTIKARVSGSVIDSLQLDLQELMFLDSVIWQGRPVETAKDGDVFWVKAPFATLRANELFSLTAYYHGKPRHAVRPPWDGGFVWTADASGKPWVAVACQGLGASSWWPCKDYQGDEPDSGATISFRSPLPVVANGRLVNSRIMADNGLRETTWEVKNPINLYNITFYAGDYVSWSDTVVGLKGVLGLSFYVLRNHEEAARKQFAVVKQMLHCFEYWLGPYPFYEDGYKLVEAPYLGMEHQSAVAYGNQFQPGYKGMDRSGTGLGMLFDYIIIHESAHEWFGNNITATDVADNWLHEGFTTYCESLFLSCAKDEAAGEQFVRGEWRNISNDRPIIGDYGVHDDGSSDKYDKGAAVVHMIRKSLQDDKKFRLLLHQLNSRFRHRTVSTKDVEEFISQFSGQDFAPLFNQYLRTTQVPTLAWYIQKKRLFYRFEQVVPGFTVPVTIVSGRRRMLLRPSAEWQAVKWKRGFNNHFTSDFLIEVK